MDKQTLKEKREAALKQNKIAAEARQQHREKYPHEYMPAFRPASKMKEGIESMPTYYHTGEMAQLLKTYKTAKGFGAPDIPAEKLAAMALIEGRQDFGYNDWNRNNKRAVSLYENLINGGATLQAAGFSAAILDKYETAQRLKIPFETAWNGTGKSIWGKTGKDYAGNIREAEKVLQHPKNQPLYNFIKQRASVDEEMPAVAATPNAVEMPQEYTEGNWRLI